MSTTFIVPNQLVLSSSVSSRKFQNCHTCKCSSSHKDTPPTSRRKFLKLASASVLFFFNSTHSTQTQAQAQSISRWTDNDLCKGCQGKGKQTCSFCQGSGTLSIDDSLVQQDHVCPNCQGVGNIRCPACIGLGLAKVNGVLRNASRKGTLRMLRNGSYEILDCSAFPACDIYGNEKRVQL